MKIVELIRLYTSDDYGTFGVLKVNKKCFCVTLERADRQNAIGESSIPAGQYTCKPYTSHKYKGFYQVMNVSGRTKILFHPGNYVTDTEGCILLGQHFDKLCVSILNSGNTFKKFRELIGKEDFHLTITECY